MLYEWDELSNSDTYFRLVLWVVHDTSYIDSSGGRGNVWSDSCSMVRAIKLGTPTSGGWTRNRTWHKHSDASSIKH